MSKDLKRSMRCTKVQPFKVDVLNASLNGCTSRMLYRSTVQSCCKSKCYRVTSFMQTNEMTTGIYHSLKTQNQETLVAIILTYLLRHKHYMQLRHNSTTNNYYTSLTTRSIERLNVRTSSLSIFCRCHSNQIAIEC